MFNGSCIEESMKQKKLCQSARKSSPSQDSVSTEEDKPVEMKAENLCELIKVQAQNLKTYYIDSRTGLLGVQCYWTFPCIYDEEAHKFFVYLGDADIDTLTKSTFMFLANFAQEEGAEKLYFILSRNHTQKTKFFKMFSIVDAKRKSSKTIEALFTQVEEGEQSWSEKYALFELELQ